MKQVVVFVVVFVVVVRVSRAYLFPSKRWKGML